MADKRTIKKKEADIAAALEDDSIAFEHYRIKAGEKQGRLRLDKFLMNRIENVSRNKLQNATKAGCIVVNGKEVKPSYQVKPNDIISILLPDRSGETELEPEKMKLDIRHEDEAIIVVNKAPGMVVHPGVGHPTGTLVQGLLYHFNDLPEANDSSIRPGLVHRLDKDTSGTLVVAKTDFAMNFLSKQFYERTVEKEYLALVWGDIEKEEGTIEGAIGRHPNHRKKMAVLEEPEKGKPAVTYYQVLERFGYVTLLACRPKTGRTHQIRVHLKYIGHPIFNDDTYDGSKIVKGNSRQSYQQFMKENFKLLPRQALHAHKITFTHPKHKERVTYQSQLPDDFRSSLEAWRKYIKSLQKK